MKTKEDSIMDLFRELLTISGDTVKQGKPECKLWKTAHKNCLGCPFELGCSKLALIGLVALTSGEDNSTLIGNTLDKILEAKTVKEVKSIHIPEMM